MTQEAVVWGVASRVHVGEVASGDDFVARAVAGGFVASVFDGLGHGEEAAVAARICRAVVGELVRDNVTSLIAECHVRLTDTRGAAVSIALLDTRQESLSWAGVGNVQGILWRAHPEGERRAERLLLRNGVVGLNLPSLRAETVRVRPGDTLVLTTDGVREDFHADIARSPQQIADAILRDHGKTTDDALVLAVRYLGGDR